MSSPKLFPIAFFVVLAFALGSVACAAQSSAATPADAAASRAKANQVLLPVAARLKNGSPAPLQLSDLTLLDEGKPQAIQSLTRELDQPFLVGLLVQTTRTLSPALEAERKAAGAFVDSILNQNATGKNELFLLHFDRQVELLQDFTASRERLRRELEEMGPSAAARRSSEGPERSGDDRQAPARGGLARTGTPNQLYDAIYLAANELMSSRQGRKALVVFSDGVDSGSKVSLNDAIDAADRASLSVYTIFLKGEAERSLTSTFPSMGGNQRSSRFPGSGGGGYPGGGQRKGDDQKSSVDGKKILEQIARRTGARVFEAKKKESLDEIHSQIADDLRSLYWLTFTPEPLDRDGGFHKVTLKSSKSEPELATREGYYALGR